jgi:hypothetical protein
MRTLARSIVPLVVVLCLSAALPALAAVVEVDTPWLATHLLTMGPGDTVCVRGTASVPQPAMENIQWLGGELRFAACRLEPQSGRLATGLPLVVGAGQSLVLEGSLIQGVPTALVLDGGSARLLDVTLAADSVAIVSQHAASRLELDQVRLCASGTGLEVVAGDSLLIKNGLFLSNGTGLRVGPGAWVGLQNCLFQGNERAIAIAPTAQPPVLLGQVDLVEARYALVENLSPQALELGDSHVDNPALLLGSFARSGADPGAPIHPLKIAASPIVIEDDDISADFIFEAVHVTSDGLPCQPSSYGIYKSSLPYSGFVLVAVVDQPGLVIRHSSSNNEFYRATARIGEWEANQ